MEFMHHFEASTRKSCKGSIRSDKKILSQNPPTVPEVREQDEEPEIVIKSEMPSHVALVDEEIDLGGPIW